MPDEITQDDIDDATKADDPRRKFVDEETRIAHAAYLKDWEWRMSTHRAVQSQYMRRRTFGLSGEGTGD